MKPRAARRARGWDGVARVDAIAATGGVRPARRPRTCRRATCCRPRNCGRRPDAASVGGRETTGRHDRLGRRTADASACRRRRHRASTARRCANRISRLSGIQAGLPAMQRRRQAHGFAVGNRSVLSSAGGRTRRLNGVVSRRKTSDRPSGETAGSLSATDAPVGYVNCRFSPVSSEITNNASGFPWPGESVTSTQSSPGHHARVMRAETPSAAGSQRPCVPVPPAAATSRTSLWLPTARDAETQSSGRPATSSGCSRWRDRSSAAEESRRRSAGRRGRGCPACPVQVKTTWLPSGENDGERTTPGSDVSGTARNGSSGGAATTGARSTTAAPIAASAASATSPAPRGRGRRGAGLGAVPPTRASNPRAPP